MSRRLAQGLDEPVAPTSPRASRAVIAIGANLGERGQTVAEAIAELDRLPLTRLVAVAEPIESVAVTLGGPDGQAVRDEDAPRYLNTVALIDTALAPSVLLEQMHRIEDGHGRVRRERWGARTLDLDVITYGDVRSDDPRLTIPHPRAAERDFVLVPWLAVDPEAVLPGHGRVADLLARLRAADAEGASAPTATSPSTSTSTPTPPSTGPSTGEATP